MIYLVLRDGPFGGRKAIYTGTTLVPIPDEIVFDETGTADVVVGKTADMTRGIVMWKVEHLPALPAPDIPRGGVAAYTKTHDVDPRGPVFRWIEK